MYEYYEYDVVYGDVLIIDSYYRWLFIHRDNKRNAAANKKGQSSKEG